MIREKTCLPVQSGTGLSTAGVGTLPSQCSIHIKRFIRSSLVKKESLLVMILMPRSESCTIPITGLLACGETIILGTIISSMVSARVSSV